VRQPSRWDLFQALGIVPAPATSNLSPLLAQTAPPAPDKPTSSMIHKAETVRRRAQTTTRFRLSERIALIMLLVPIAAGLAFSQVDRTTITGTVLDPSGKAIPDSVVVATSTDTGIARQARSNTKGVYELYDLPVGVWTVVFSAPGFASTRYEGLEQTVGNTRTLNPVLAVASGKEQITVTDVLPQVNQASASIGESVEERAIEDLPLNGRNWTSLTALAPGAIDQGGSTSRSIRFTGHGRDEMNITLDGVDATGIVNQAQKAFVRLAIPLSAIS